MPRTMAAVERSLPDLDKRFDTTDKTFLLFTFNLFFKLGQFSLETMVTLWKTKRQVPENEVLDLFRLSEILFYTNNQTFLGFQRNLKT